MHHRVNDCLYVLTYVYEYAKMLNEFVKDKNECRFIKMNVFLGNETDNCVIESIFSGNDQQKVYLYIYLFIYLFVGLFIYLFIYLYIYIYFFLGGGGGGGGRRASLL